MAGFIGFLVGFFCGVVCMVFGALMVRVGDINRKEESSDIDQRM